MIALMIAGRLKLSRMLAHMIILLSILYGILSGPVHILSITPRVVEI